VCVCVAQDVYSEEIILKIRLLYFHTHNQIYLNLFYHLRSHAYYTRMQTNEYTKLESSYCYFLAFRYLVWWILIPTLRQRYLCSKILEFFFIYSTRTHVSTCYLILYNILWWWNYMSNISTYMYKPYLHLWFV